MEDRRLLSISLQAGDNVNISFRIPGDQAEGTLAVDPTDPSKMFAASMTLDRDPGLFGAFSINGGATWTRRFMGTGDGAYDSLPAASGDVHAAYDRFGNLFLVYLTVQAAQTGAASSADNTTLTDVGRNWTTNMWDGCTVSITGSSNAAGQDRAIVSPPTG